MSWKDHISNSVLYGELPKVTDKIKQRRLKLVGHCQRHEEEIAHSLVFWTPTHGKRKRGKPALSYIKQLEMDTELSVEEMKTLTGDRRAWRILTGRGITTST